MRQHVSPVDNVQRYRCVVIRNTYAELRTTTIKTFHEWIPEDSGTFLQTAPMVHRIVGKVESHAYDWEWLFLALDRPDHIKKLLSLEVTDAWINEAREVPKPVLDHLTVRVGRYPSKRHGGAVNSTIFMDTNSPDIDHWWATLSDHATPQMVQSNAELEQELHEMGGLRPGQKLMEFYTQPSAEDRNGKQNPEAENLSNLPVGYYVKAKAGKKDDWIKVYVRNEYGFVMDGKVIYEGFRENMHVKNVQYNPHLKLEIGLDFGLTPAAVIAQRTPMGQVRCLSEVVATRLGAKNFARELKSHITMTYGAEAMHKIGTITGDPSGNSGAQTDETTVFEMLRSEGVKAKPASTNDFDIRVEAVTDLLGKLIDGEPALVISPECRMLRKACAGGYHYRRVQMASELRYEQKPNKNEFSHVAEALQYLCMGLGIGKEVVKPADHIPFGSRPQYAQTEYDMFNSENKPQQRPQRAQYANTGD